MIRKLTSMYQIIISYKFEYKNKRNFLNTGICATMVKTSTLNLWGSWLKDESPQYISYDGFVPTNKCVEVKYYIFQYENLNINAGFL